MAHVAQGLLPRALKVCTRVLDGLLSPVCVLCQAPLTGQCAPLGLCAHCAQGLPRPTNPCPRCGEPGAAAEGQCMRCRSDPPAFVATLVLVDFAAPIDRLVHALKFRRERALARPMGLLMAEQLARVRASDQSSQDQRFCPLGLVPIPLSAERLAQRGFNQAQAIAQALAESSGVAVHNRLLRRARHTTAQAELDSDQRRENLAGAFQCRAASPTRVALVDDVMTTGATLRAAALALQQAGARTIINLVFARTAADHVSRRPGPS